MARLLSRIGSWAFFSLGIAIAAIAAIVVPAGASSRAVQPVVLAIQVNSRSVPDTGGVVHFTVRTKGANECRMAVAGSAGAAVAFSRAWERCSFGTFRHAVRLAPNFGQTVQRVAFHLYLRSGLGVYWTSLGIVRVSATPAPAQALAPTASLSINTSSLTSAGGSITLTYSSTNASSCSLSASPAFWTGNNPFAVNCGGTYSATVPSSSVARQWTFTFIVTNSGGQSASSSQVLTQTAPAPPPAPAFGQSSNWSGYVVSSNSTLTTYASGQWTVPTLNCVDTPNAGSSTWVGIGGAGAGTGDLLQTGVRTDCVSGVQENVGWWEEYPEVAEIDFTSFPVSPGDSIEAFDFQITSNCTTSCGQWETKVEDLTSGLEGIEVTGGGWGVAPISSSTYTYQGTTPSLAYAGGYTGEWIVEDYESNGSLVSFANYGTVNFSNLLLAGLSPWYLTVNEGVELVQNGVTLSTPSPPSSDSFSVSYTGP